MDDRECEICGGYDLLLRKGRCNACRMYFMRHGHERPGHLIERHGERLAVA